MTRPDFTGQGVSRLAADPWEPWRFAVLLAFLSVICLTPATLQAGGGSDGVSEGTLFNQVSWIAMLLLSFVTMQDGWARVRFQFSPSLFLALAWMLLTVWPSLAPDVAIRRYIFTVIVIAVTVVCAASPRDDNALVKAFVIIALIEIVLKYAVVFGMPSVGIHSANGTEPQLAGLWRGHHSHKNLAGAFCVMEIFAFLAMRKRIPFLYLLVPIILDLIFLIYVGSKTSIGLIAITMVLAWIASRVRGTVAIAVVVGGVLIAINVLTLLSIYNETVQEISSDIVGDVTFTGRTDLWRFLIDYISNHPWTGSGFQSFWQVGPISPAKQDGRSWLAGTPYGHQGYLDLAAAVGIPGLVLACLFAVVRPINDLGRIQSRHDPVLQMYLMFWIFGLLHNATESSLFDRANPVWVFTLIGICGVRRVMWREGQSSSNTSAQHVPVRKTRNPSSAVS